MSSNNRNIASNYSNFDENQYTQNLQQSSFLETEVNQNLTTEEQLYEIPVSRSSVYRPVIPPNPIFSKENTIFKKSTLINREIFFLLIGFFGGLTVALIFCVQINKIYIQFLLTGLL